MAAAPLPPEDYDAWSAAALPQLGQGVLPPSLGGDINMCTLGDDGDCIVDTGVPLASNSSSTVYQGKYYGESVAVKMLRVRLGEDEAAVRQRILREVQLQAPVANHSGVVRFLAVCFSPPAIMMEPCECSLSACINHWAAQQAPPAQQQQQQQYPELSWGLVVDLLCQAAAVLAFLHRPAGTTLHNDLRAANMVLIRTFEPGRWRLKLCEFGLSVSAGADGAAQVLEVTHACWQAPELAEGLNPLSRMFTVTKAADVFALGCVMHELMVPGLPQPHFPAAEARLPALADPPPAGLQQLFDACVHQLPQQRPTALAVLQTLRSIQVV